MKNIKILFSTFLLTFVFINSVYASIKTVVTDLNVRQAPNKDSQIIDVLPQGLVIDSVTSENSNWDKLECENYIGYIYNSYLIEENNKNEISAQEEEVQIKTQKIFSKEEFQYAGIINWGGWQWTYYLMSQFPGLTSTPVEGRYVNEDGFVCDGDGYIILASVDLPPYTIVQTPFGYVGKVYDTGCPHGILDVYTNW